MSEHHACIHWHREQAKFIDNKYSREHTWKFDGGAEVLASASPQVVPAPYVNPAGVDPEEAFVAALSSCHMLWFLAIAAKKGFVVESYTDQAVGNLGPNEQGKLSITEVRLHPQIVFGGDTSPSDQQLKEMHEEAHHSCFLANSVKAAVIVEAIAAA